MRAQCLGRLRFGRIVAEALKVHGLKTGNEARDIVADIFRKVGLRASDMQKFANEFSGGQRQRIGIARIGSETEPDRRG